MSRPKGFTLTPEHKAKIASALKGNKNTLARYKNSYKWSKEAKEKRKQQWKGKSWGNYRFPKGHIPWNKGKKMPSSMSQKMKIVANNRVGEKAANWIDGRSFKPYPCGFTNKLKLQIRQRDNFICQLCDMEEKNYKEKLAIHHIDYNKENLSVNNLITLCRSCNSKVNDNREHWSNYFKEKIQRL